MWKEPVFITLRIGVEVTM
ncbi:pyrroloquinoline quinone precursor peptide PqqA [Pseudomonas sp.]